jgi:drug/metabolite transporter (DMT)-like permease
LQTNNQVKFSSWQYSIAPGHERIHGMQELTQYIPLLIPLFLLQLVLTAAALIDIFRHKRTKGPQWVWVLVVIFVTTIGPIIYFLAGREES